MPVYEDNTKSIGRTPLVRINRLDASSGATILASKQMRVTVECCARPRMTRPRSNRVHRHAGP